MRYIHIDVADLCVQFVDDGDLALAFIEMNGLHAGVYGKARHSRRPASLAHDKRHLAGPYFGIGLFHLLDRPWLEDGIAGVGDAIGRLTSAAIRDIGAV